MASPDALELARTRIAELEHELAICKSRHDMELSTLRKQLASLQDAYEAEREDWNELAVELKLKLAGSNSANVQLEAEFDEERALWAAERSALVLMTDPTVSPPATPAGALALQQRVPTVSDGPTTALARSVGHAQSSSALDTTHLATPHRAGTQLQTASVGRLEPCGFCTRSFGRKAIDRHREVCAKNVHKPAPPPKANRYAQRTPAPAAPSVPVPPANSE